jgi:hypothetical protein
MAKQTINIGTSENKGDGESIRSAFDKINDNFDELYAYDAPYTPADATQWSTPPTTVGEALDMLADYIYQAHGNNPI